MTDPGNNSMADLCLRTQRYEILFDNISTGLCMFDAGRRLLLSNRFYAKLYGLAPEAIRPGMTLQEIMALRAAAGSAPKMSLDRYLACSESSATMMASSGTLVELMNGHIMENRFRPLPDGGYVAAHVDVTEQQHAKARLVHLAHHDMLTGLANRTLLRETLEAALADCDEERPCAVICVDLDRFKDINDTLGHAVGDEVLRAVAARLREAVPPGDLLARAGNNEFIAIQRGGPQPANALALWRTLEGALARTFQVLDQAVIVSASCGIAVAPRDGQETERMLRNAALALSAARAGGGRAELFAPPMNAAAQRRRMLDSDLRSAVARGEMALAYQPVARLKAARVGGFEALLRWTHRSVGRISPTEFIPLSEQNGQILPIGAWVLKTACTEAADWPDNVKVAVNVSAAQFVVPGLLETVADALEGSGLAPSRLELEITESALMRNWQETAAVLTQIKQLGVRISMDDFGTGYSSLSYLRRFPFDKVKIDQSFIRELTTNGQSVAIIRAILALCDALGMTTTAEGVETREQYNILASEGCTEVQGYLLSEPQPANAVPGLLARLNDGRLGATSRPACRPAIGRLMRPAFAAAAPGLGGPGRP